jgi:phosphatidyl-myo-inositol alpha-mannosyltransferase
MKIGIVTEYYYPTLGGIQEHVHHFAVAARRAGHDVRILTPRVRDGLATAPGSGNRPSVVAARDVEDGVIRVGESVPLLSAGSIGRASVGRDLSRRMEEILASERFDIIHAHSPLTPTLPFLALRASDAINVGTFHAFVPKSVIYGLFRAVFQRYADRLHAAIGVSETALEGIRQYVNAPWRIVPNGVDVSMFAFERRRPEFDDGRLNLLHVGRFDPRNGVDRVIKAWVAVRRGGTDARLILVGDGPLRPRYEALVPDDLRSDASFVGFVPGEQRASYYASGDVLLCPAVGGTFGIIALEAMAAGCAVVAADTPGFRNIMTDGTQGFMVDVARDPDSAVLAERAVRLLTDRALRARCSAAGRETAARFDWPAVTARVLSIYDELRGAARAQRPSAA